MFYTASSNSATRCHGSCISPTFPHPGSNYHTEPQVRNTCNFFEFSTNCFPSNSCSPRTKARFSLSLHSCLLRSIFIFCPKIFKRSFLHTISDNRLPFQCFNFPFLSTKFFQLIFSSMFCFLISRKNEPSCKLLYVTPERIAGNSSFLEILKGLHWKVKISGFQLNSSNLFTTREF